MMCFIHNAGLFRDSYFQRVVADPKAPRERRLPRDAAGRVLDAKRFDKTGDVARVRCYSHRGALAPVGPLT